MDISKYYEEAQKLAIEAKKLDVAGKLEDAYDKYERAATMIITTAKSDSRKEIRETYLQHAAMYIDRIEVIKDSIKNNSSPVAGPGGAVATRRGAGAGGGSDAKDDESAKRKAELKNSIVGEKPNVRWTDIAGLESAKEALREATTMPKMFPQMFVGNRKPWKGILLYGPPGTGKSFLAKAVATEDDSTFFSISASDLVSKWQGEGEKNVRNMFEMARENKPSIIFIDEVDSLCRERGGGSENESSRRMLTEFLVQMQGVGKSMDGVLVLAATNTPWEIDAAIRRRFEKRIYIPLPEAPARAKMFQLNLEKTPNNLREEDFKMLGESTDGLSGSDIANAVHEAIMEPVRKCRTARYFKKAPDGKLTPEERDPPCTQCIPDLASKPAPINVICKGCGCVRLDMFNIEDKTKLVVPEVCFADFEKLLKTSMKSSVAKRELERYVKWTEEFGVDGS